MSADCSSYTDNGTRYTLERSGITRWRLWYAERGIKTSLADAAGKKPVLKGWQEKATRQPSQITAEGNTDKEVYRQATGILMPTGRMYGGWILDDDGGLEELEKHLGITLRGTTLEVRTPSGKRHLHFLWPRDGEELRGSVGKTVGDGFEVDVRGEGNLALLPPTPGYSFGNELRTIEAPPELVAWARGRTGKKPSGEIQPRATEATGELIPDGARHDTLASIAGRLHDGTRSLEQLTADLHRINEERCSPPIGSAGDDPISDIDRLAAWAHGLVPCTPSRPTELTELISALSNWWRNAERIGLGAKNEIRFARLLITEGLRAGEAIEDGLRVSLAERQAATLLNCHKNTIRKLKHRMISQGLLRYDKSECQTRNPTGLNSGAFVLLLPEPHHACTTPTKPPPPVGERELEGGGTRAVRPDVPHLQTAHFRHLGPVGISREDTLCFAELHPGSTSAELAEVMGWTRARNLEQKHLVPLAELGLLERDDEGRYWTPENYGERQDEAKRIAYSTLQRRLVRSWSASEGRWVHYVAETGSVASQVKRQEADEAYYEVERERLRRELEKDTPSVELAEDEHVTGDGQVVREEHPERCGCPTCYYEQLREETA